MKVVDVEARTANNIASDRKRRQRLWFKDIAARCFVAVTFVAVFFRQFLFLKGGGAWNCLQEQKRTTFSKDRRVVRMFCDPKSLMNSRADAFFFFAKGTSSLLFSWLLVMEKTGQPPLAFSPSLPEGAFDKRKKQKSELTECFSLLQL